MDFHEAADIFPMLSEEELNELAADIAASGLLHEITICDNKILDGRNRYLACQASGIEPRFQQFTGTDPLRFVVSSNMKRRHLTREQRDVVIRRLRANGMTLQAIADTVGVGRDTVHRATKNELSDFGKLKSADGKYRPTHYAPRQMPHVAHNSGNNEWYTPKEYIERAVAVMGAIDLDPASTAIANEIVGATRFYAAEEDGLTKRWKGRVFMNPPYASDLVGKFIDKLLASTGVTEAMVLVNNATETKWFQSLAQRATAICFPAGRVRFWNPKKESAAPLQGQAVLYLGENSGPFAKHFSDLGTTWRR